ncbi:unnamed protein product, partial [Acanthoscelides obtectus]
MKNQSVLRALNVIAEKHLNIIYTRSLHNHYWIFLSNISRTNTTG